MWLLFLFIDIKTCQGWTVSVCILIVILCKYGSCLYTFDSTNVPRYSSLPHCVTVHNFSGVIIKEGLDRRIIKVGKDL